MATTPPTLLLLTVADLAAEFQVRKRTIYDLVRDAGLPDLRLGRALRFRPADIIRPADISGWLSARNSGTPIAGGSSAPPKLPPYDWSRSRA